MVHEPFENSFEPLYKMALVFLVNVNGLEQMGIDSDNSFSGAAEVSKIEDLLQDSELPLQALSIEHVLHLTSVSQ